MKKFLITLTALSSNYAMEPLPSQGAGQTEEYNDICVIDCDQEESITRTALSSNYAMEPLPSQGAGQTEEDNDFVFIDCDQKEQIKTKIKDLNIFYNQIRESLKYAAEQSSPLKAYIEMMDVIMNTVYNDKFSGRMAKAISRNFYDNNRYDLRWWEFMNNPATNNFLETLESTLFMIKGEIEKQKKITIDNKNIEKLCKHLFAFNLEPLLAYANFLTMDVSYRLFCQNAVKMMHRKRSQLIRQFESIFSTIGLTKEEIFNQYQEFISIMDLDNRKKANDNDSRLLTPEDGPWGAFGTSQDDFFKVFENMLREKATGKNILKFLAISKLLQGSSYSFLNTLSVYTLDDLLGFFLKDFLKIRDEIKNDPKFITISNLQAGLFDVYMKYKNNFDWNHSLAGAGQENPAPARQGAAFEESKEEESSLA